MKTIPILLLLTLFSFNNIMPDVASAKQILIYIYGKGAAEIETDGDTTNATVCPMSDPHTCVIVSLPFGIKADGDIKGSPVYVKGQGIDLQGVILDAGPIQNNGQGLGLNGYELSLRLY
ncbi:MAG: hypothetical protein IH946_10415 [Bacteroidetes bacterium]|nr:hypothetical protein [Bacteroidota bacterium]